MQRSTVAAAFVVALAVPTGAAAQFSRHAYDIASYDLNIHPDFTTGEISLRVVITIANAAASDSFGFGLSPRYREVTARANGRPADLTRTGSTISVSNARHDAAVVLQFDLAGSLGKSDDEDRDVIDKDSLFLLWSDRFYPIDYVDWAPVRTSILLPDDMLAIAVGTERATIQTGGGIWRVFESRTPAVNFSVLADRRWIRSTWKIGGLTMTTLLHPEAASFAPALHRTSADIVRFYTSLHGYYPADAFAFVTVRGMFARRAFPGFVAYEPPYLERMLASDGYDAHETSLLWWGYASHGEGPGAFQWTEGFGDYVEILYTRSRHKPVSVNLQRARERYLALDPTSDVPVARLSGSSPQPVIHGKLPWIMDAVRAEMGAARFGSAIRALFQRFKWRTFTLDEFVSTFERGAPARSRPRIRSLILGGGPTGRGGSGTVSAGLSRVRVPGSRDAVDAARSVVLGSRRSLNFLYDSRARVSMLRGVGLRRRRARAGANG